MIDLDEIERLARAATPGKWSVRETVINGIGYGGHWVETDHEDLIQITGSGGARSFTHRVFDRQIHDDNEANAAYIAAANPATVLALVARLRAAEAALREIADQHIGDCPASLSHITDEEWARRCYGHLRKIALAALKPETTP